MHICFAFIVFLLIFAKITILDQFSFMIKKLTIILLLISISFQAIALCEFAAGQDIDFCSGNLTKNIGMSVVFFNKKSPEIDSVISEYDKIIVAFYDLLAKQSVGFFYTVSAMPSYQYFKSKMDDNHYMSLIINALYEPDFVKSVAACDKAIEAIADTYGEDSWEYAYMHNIKGQRLIQIGAYDEAKKVFKKYFELTAANGRAKWWPNATVYSYLALAELYTKVGDFPASNIEAAVNAFKDVSDKEKNGLFIVPWMNFFNIFQIFGDGARALDIALDIHELLEQWKLQDTEIYAYAKQCVGIGYSMTGNQKEALKWFDRAMKEYKRLGIENCSYATSLNKWIAFAKSKK